MHVDGFIRCLKKLPVEEKLAALRGEYVWILLPGVCQVEHVIKWPRVVPIAAPEIRPKQATSVPGVLSVFNMTFQLQNGQCSSS
jgi:hypothetical protein